MDALQSNHKIWSIWRDKYRGERNWKENLKINTMTKQKRSHAWSLEGIMCIHLFIELLRICILVVICYAINTAHLRLIKKVLVSLLVTIVWHHKTYNWFQWEHKIIKWLLLFCIENKIIKGNNIEDLPVAGDSCVVEQSTTKFPLWWPSTRDLELNERSLVLAWLLRG